MLQPLGHNMANFFLCMDYKINFTIQCATKNIFLTFSNWCNHINRSNMYFEFLKVKSFPLQYANYNATNNCLILCISMCVQVNFIFSMNDHDMPLPCDSMVKNFMLTTNQSFLDRLSEDLLSLLNYSINCRSGLEGSCGVLSILLIYTQNSARSTSTSLRLT